MGEYMYFVARTFAMYHEGLLNNLVRDTNSLLVLSRFIRVLLFFLSSEVQCEWLVSITLEAVFHIRNLFRGGGV